MCIAGCWRSWWLVPGGVFEVWPDVFEVWTWPMDCVCVTLFRFWISTSWTRRGAWFLDAVLLDPERRPFFSWLCTVGFWNFWCFEAYLEVFEAYTFNESGVWWHHLDPNFRHFVCSGFGCLSCGPRHWLPFHESEFSILHGGLCFKLRPFHLLLESGDLSDLVQNKVWKFKKKWIDNFIIF